MLVILFFGDILMLSVLSFEVASSVMDTSFGLSRIASLLSLPIKVVLHMNRILIECLIFPMSQIENAELRDTLFRACDGVCHLN